MNELRMRVRALARALPRLAAAPLALLTGCAGFSADGGFGAVEQLTLERTGQRPVLQRTAQPGEAVKARVAELLGQPLTADGAVELALLNSPGLQAGFQALGIAEADRVRSGRPANPALGFSRVSGGGRLEIGRTVGFDVLGLLTLPLAHGVEARRFEQAKLRAASDAVAVAAEARQAWFQAVAAQELAGYFEQVMEAADASRELANRMAAAGNFSKLAQLREQAFHADASTALARAQHRALVEREVLTRRLGLSGPQGLLRLPQRLPDLPTEPVAPDDAEQTAMDRRLDVMMARQATTTVADALGLSKATRMVNVLHLGYANASETGEARKDGYEIAVELPLFDFGTTRVARAEAIYLQALHRAAQTAVDARSEVRQSYSAYRTAYELARHYRDEIVPLRRRISEENLLRYNGMLIGVFDLLADSREQIASVAAYVEAMRDFWITDTRLQTALTGGSPRTADPSQPATLAAGSGQAH